MRPLLELHDVFELVFDEVLSATAGAAVTVSNTIEASDSDFMAFSKLTCRPNGNARRRSIVPRSPAIR